MCARVCDADENDDMMKDSDDFVSIITQVKSLHKQQDHESSLHITKSPKLLSLNKLYN